MIERHLLIVFITLITFTLNTSANLNSSYHTLSGISNPINVAVKNAERMFEENHGYPMRTSFSLIEVAQNPYISILKIETNYFIKLKISGNNNISNTSGAPVATPLLGAEFILRPVYNKHDEKITTWECLTNADKIAKKFIEHGGTQEYTISYVGNYTDNLYLSLCM